MCETKDLPFEEKILTLPLYPFKRLCSGDLVSNSCLRGISILPLLFHLYPYYQAHNFPIPYQL